MPIEEIIRQDDLNQFPWQSIVTSVDTDTGEVLGRTSTYDDGTKTDQLLENGVLRESFQSDNFDQFGQPLPGGGAKRWESIQTFYDAEGQPEFKTIIFDDGTRTDQRFENGVLRESFQSDNFDQFGQPLPGGGAKPWESIETRFDANGDIETRSITGDNGVQTEQFYTDGVLREFFQTDGFDLGETPPADGGVFDWRGKLTIYDADGSITSRGTVFDDDDQIIFNYENAQIIERLRIDGDGDEDWLLSVTTYADTGPETVNYETLGDVPSQYLEYFGVIA
ncbi:hypothetical protein [Cognatiyoonia sp. IB215182]|uniref:hypothetical protein n=1 Tax=Cognatiyoonia sp. IB215182 TaxID=3097353 RepID=UPI002A0C24F2|nr:hypothetical protein [Cognatiyoonia sp. IB215182]MDX8353648.1 hypothetical protein [Cognatiyoonia sp. IB215182]